MLIFIFPDLFETLTLAFGALSILPVVPRSSWIELLRVRKDACGNGRFDLRLPLLTAGISGSM